MSTGASREAPVDNRCSSTVLTTRNPGIPAIGILARLRRLSLGAVATSALFSLTLPAADSPRMASISLGMLLGSLCGGSIYTPSKKLSNRYMDYLCVLPTEHFSKQQTRRQWSTSAYIAMLCSSRAQGNWRSQVTAHAQAKYINAL